MKKFSLNVFFLLVLLLVAACGSEESTSFADVAATTEADAAITENAEDSSGDAAETNTAENESTENGTTEDETAEQAQAEADTEDSEAATTEDDSSSEFCAMALEIEANDPLQGLFLGEPGFFSELDGIYTRLSEVAPTELESDIQIIREKIDQVAPAFENGDLFSDEAEAAMDQLDDPEFVDAGSRFDAYLTDVCGVENPPGSSGSGPVTEPSDDVGDNTMGDNTIGDVDIEALLQGAVTGTAPIDEDATLDETVRLDGEGEVAGAMEVGTYDIYEVEVPDDATLTVTMEAISPDDIDTVLVINDPDGESVYNDDADPAAGIGTYESQVVIDSAVGGLYIIEAHSLLGVGSGEFTLTVEID